VNLVVGSGGTICREAALMGIPTINFHFWDAIAKYLFRKGFPVHYMTDMRQIIKVSRRILKKKHRVDTKHVLEQLENPVPVTVNHVRMCLRNIT
jgi:predicted glycosyltransferase